MADLYCDLEHGRFEPPQDVHVRTRELLKRLGTRNPHRAEEALNEVRNLSPDARRHFATQVHGLAMAMMNARWAAVWLPVAMGVQLLYFGVAEFITTGVFPVITVGFASMGVGTYFLWRGKASRRLLRSVEFVCSLDEPTVIPALLDMALLKDPRVHLPARDALLRTLPRLDLESVAPIVGYRQPSFWKLLRTDDHRLVLAAVNALALAGDRTSLVALNHMLDSGAKCAEPGPVRDAVISAVKAIELRVRDWEDGRKLLRASEAPSDIGLLRPAGNLNEEDAFLVRPVADMQEQTAGSTN